MAIVEAVLALIAACIGLALLARRLGVPYAVILVLGGMVLAFMPHVPEVRLDPELALAFFLPPLLQASGYRTDWRSFRNNLRPILLLAVGCVIFTALCIAATARWLVPEMPWAAAVALGAIVAPPDAVAAGAVLSRLRLPRRLVTILEGESLVNDATALVLYRFAVVAVAVGAVSPWAAAGSFLLLAIGGVALGWAVGQAVIWLIPRLHNTLLEIAASFVACWLAYLGAEALHLSGVMAVVTVGILFGRAQHGRFDSRLRVAARTVWEFAEFVLNSLVFILIGLQLNGILGRLDGAAWRLAGIALVISAILILSRIVWVSTATALPRLVPSIRRDDPANWRMVAIVSWAGMRGVVSLAAALALPADFPQRDLIVFLAFAAILATLVLQGTTLEWVIRRVGLEQPPHEAGIPPEEAEARRIIAAAALAEIEGRLADPLEGAIANDIVGEYRDRAGHLHRTAHSRAAVAAERAARRRLRTAALDAGRAALIAHHRDGKLHEEALVRLETELDMEEFRIRQVLGDGH